MWVNPVKIERNFRLRKCTFRNFCQVLCEESITRMLVDQQTRNRTHRNCSTKNTAAVAQSVLEDHGMSTGQRFQGLNILLLFLRRVLQKDVGMTACKIQSIQELKPGDH